MAARKEEWTEGREKEVRHHVVLDAVNDVLFEDVDHEVEGDSESRTYTQMCMYNNITRAKIKIRAHPHTHPCHGVADSMVRACWQFTAASGHRKMASGWWELDSQDDTESNDIDGEAAMSVV